MIVDREKEIIFNIYKSNSAQTARHIAGDLESVMAEGNTSGVISSIRVFNAQNNIWIGVVGPAGDPAFGTSLRVSEDIFKKQQISDEIKNDEFLYYYPLKNESRCHACHSSNDEVRGMIVVKTSSREARNAIASTAKRLVLFALVIGLASEAFLFLVLRRTVLRPIANLTGGAVRLQKGDLSHRIVATSMDEIGTLTACFNEMAESIEKAHDNLEKAVRQKTRELSAVAEVSTDVFRGDSSLSVIIDKFLDVITEKMGFGYSVVCLVDKETSLLTHAYTRKIDKDFCEMEISLASEHPLAVTICQATPAIRMNEEIGIRSDYSNSVIVPILSHQRRRCRDINLCTLYECPAFETVDERCWLVPDTLCRSPQSLAGKEKIYGCTRCDAFPILGILIAGKEGDTSKSTLDSLEILASEIASAIENQKLLESKQEDIEKLIKLHDISVDSLHGPVKELARTIAVSAAAFSDSDAALLWLHRGDGRYDLAEAYNIDKALVPETIPPDDLFVMRSIREKRPFETLEMPQLGFLGKAVDAGGFRHAITVPLEFQGAMFGCFTAFGKSDMLMTDSQGALLMLFANQAASALNTSGLFSSLQDEKEYSDAIFNRASGGIMVLDGDGRILKVNLMGLKILHMEISQLQGKKITDIFPESEDMLSFGMGPGKELLLALPGGRSVPIGFNNSPLFHEADDKQDIIVLFQDLSEVKKLQEELRKKEHFETMGKVVSGVAHEIRNPLFGISSIGQILERELDSEQHLKLVQAMLRETERMKNLVEELLLYTRPSRLHIKKFDVTLVLEEMGTYVSARKESLAVSFEFQKPLIISADREKFTQVLLNIIDNAIDAAGSRITITGRPLDNGRIEISLSDDGPGIAANNIERIFDPFFTTKKSGTGLGLPICKKIVEDHGGEIDVTSSPENGTTVILRLPA